MMLLAFSKVKLIVEISLKLEMIWAIKSVISILALCVNWWFSNLVNNAKRLFNCVSRCMSFCMDANWLNCISVTDWPLIIFSILACIMAKGVCSSWETSSVYCFKFS